MRCEAELCVHWAGDGCVCSVFDLDPEHGEYCECVRCFGAYILSTTGEPPRLILAADADDSGSGATQ